MSCWDDPEKCPGCVYCDEGSPLTPIQARRLEKGKPAGGEDPTPAEAEALLSGRPL